MTFVYLTGYATPDGRAHFRDDIYGIDSPAPAAATGPDVTTTGSIAPKASARPVAKGTPIPAAPAMASAAKPAPFLPPAIMPAPKSDVEAGPVPPGLIPGRAGRPART